MSRPQSTRPPVDEDVDDLDDVLEQFTPAQGQKPPPPSASSASAPAPASTSSPAPSAGKAKSKAPPTTLDDLDMSDDFARELAAGMASLMREIAGESEPASDAKAGEKKLGPEPPVTDEEKKREEAFRKAWEEMMVEGMDGKLEKGKEKEKGKVEEGVEEGFQDSIKRAMERMRESEDGLHADSTHDDDELEQLLKSLSDNGSGNPEDQLKGLLEGMMSSLMAKEVLYEPMKELHEKFPAYMAEHGASLKPEIKKRYEDQQVVVARIIKTYDDPKYTAENVEMNAEIVMLMTEMQNLGSPPVEIMGPVPPGFDVGEDGLPKMPGECVIA